MDKKYNPQLVEKGMNQKWIDKEYFSTRDKSKEPFSILLPPPNVTGKLHLGHAWDTMIQDTLIRYKKLQGFDAFWIAGMDHAGIATQAKVEEKLRNNNMPNKYELGREKFIEKVWDWKEEYASHIRAQWSKLGLALDYKRERFTMDEGLSDAVEKVFIDLYHKGLIYKGKRPVNWDPKLQTVLSNIEVESKDTTQTMYYIKYDILDSDKNISIATVRPETLFSDVAIAINPKDETMNSFIGLKARHPLTNIELPIIADSNIEIGKGTGAMKVSAHAEMDFEILKQNDLPVIECIARDGKMNKQAGEFEGQDRFEARKNVILKLKEQNRIIKEQETTSAVGYSERSGEAVEILVQPQWFVKMKPLAEKLLANLSSEDKVNFYPLRFKDTMVQWMENIHDWCISRQLWWGHRIPVWYKNEEIKVQKENPGEGWVQDEDVLDTWFSSGIAPFSFLGWPNSEEMVNRYYPSSVLVTGYDIIFFWVARMYFQGLEIMNKKPFEKVLLHGLIRAEDGRKMSKSLGNGIDPMDVIEKYGSDALRWFLLTNSTPGQDIRYSTEKLEAAWNQSNKLWNISRYILEVMEEKNQEPSIADKWIESKLTSLEEVIETRMEDFEFTIIGKEINKFIMDDFSSWYIEMSKGNPNKAFAKEVLKRLMIALHPFMPFISDYIYNLIDGQELLEVQKWSKTNKYDTKEVDRAIDIIKLFREFRVDKKMSNKDLIEYEIDAELTEVESNIINKLANASQIKTKGALIVYGDININIKLSKEQEESEKLRVSKEIKRLQSEVKRAESMLSNERFLAKAPENKIKEEQEKLKKYKIELEQLLKGSNNGNKKVKK